MTQYEELKKAKAEAMKQMAEDSMDMERMMLFGTPCWWAWAGKYKYPISRKVRQRRKFNSSIH